MTLDSYLREKKLSDEQFAALAKVDRTTVLRWRNRTTVPGHKAQQKIFLLTKGAVAPNDFADLAPLSKGQAA